MQRCIVCGREFVRHRRAITCSPVCRKSRGRGPLADNETNAKILDLYHQGERQKDIARVIGISHPAVRQRLLQARLAGQLPPKRKPVPVAMLAPDTAWERLRAELVEAHRREFLTPRIQVSAEAFSAVEKLLEEPPRANAALKAAFVKGRG